MKTVQVAIHDPRYADSIRDLLVQDGQHWVDLVEMPDVALEGVMLVDAARLNSSPWLPAEQERLLVIVHKERDNLSNIWNVGIRHVIFRGDSPQTACIAVLSLELSLSFRVATCTA